MFNKTKANLKLKKDSSDLQRHYGFRKFSVGLAGALLSSTFLLTGTGHAVHAANTNTNNDPDTATDENTPENDIKDFKTTDDLEDENDADDVSQDTTVEKSTDQAKAKKEEARKKRLAKLKAEEAKKKREEEARKKAEAEKEASKDAEKSSDKEDTSITSDEDSTDDLDDNTVEEKSGADQTKSDKASKSNEDKTEKSSDDKEAQDQEKSTKDDTDDLKSSTNEDQTKQAKKADELDKEANEKLQKQEQDAQKEQKSDQAKLDQAKEADQKQEAKLNAQLKRDEEQQAARQAKSVKDLQKEDKLSTEQANKLKDALNDSEVQDQLRASAIRTQALTDSKETTTNLNDNKTKQAAENDEARQESGDIDVSNTDSNAQVTRTYTINYRYPQESDIQSYSNTYTIRKKRSATLDPATGETTYGKWQDAGSNLKTTKININTMHVEGYKLNTNIPTDQLSTENGQNYVSYLNDENGDPNDPANLKPSFDYTVNYTADTPSANTFTVPKFTRLAFRPAMFMTLAANDDEEGNKSETRIRNIVIHMPDGTTQTETQSVTATDLQNGLFPKFDLSSYIPSGYEARINDKAGQKVAYVSEMDATLDDPETQTTNVYIVPQEQTVQIKYFDDTSGQEVMTKQYTGHHGDVVKIGINDPDYGPGVGYQFAGSDPDNATITLTGVDSFTIHIKEKGQTVLHTSPIPAYSSDGHGGYYPAGLDENSLNRTLTRTINVTLPNGQLSQIVQKVQLYRDATYNAAKTQDKQVTYTDWKSDKGDIAFDAYTPNQVQGYTPVYEVNGKEYNSVPAESITDILKADPTLSADDNLNNYNDPRIDINYEKAEGQIVVAFVDNANSGRTIKTVTVNGKPGSHLDFKSDPKLAIPNDYQLDPSSQALYDAGYDFAADGSTNNVTLSVIAKSTDVSDTDPGAHKVVTRTIRITYPKAYLNDHSNDPTIDQTTGQQIVKQTLVFKRSAQKDAATGQVNYGAWQYQDPNTKQWMNVSDGVVTMPAYTVPEIPGYSANTSGDLGENYIYVDSNDNQDQTIDVTYTGDVQTGTVNFVDDDNNGATIGTWQFSGRASEDVPISPQIPDDRYELASGQTIPDHYPLTAGGNNTITVHLVHKKHNVTEAEAPNQLERTITRTINVTTPDQGQGTSLETTVQSVTFTRTGVMDDVTGKITYSQWIAKDGKDTFDEYVPKAYPGFSPNVKQLSKVTVTPDTLSEVDNISYDQGAASLTVDFQDTDGKTIGSQVLSGRTGETVNYGLALQPPTGYKIADGQDITPTYVLDGTNPTVTVKVQHTSTVEDDTMIVKRVIHYVDENGNKIAPDDTINLVLHRDKTVDDVDKSKVTYGDWKPASFDSYSVKPVTGYHLSSTEKHPGNLNVLPAINGVDGKIPEYDETVYFTKDAGDGTVTVKYVNRQGETVGTKKYTGKIGDSIIPTYEQDVPDGYIIDQNANVDVIDITGPTNPDVTITVHKQGEDSQHVVHVKFVSDDGKTVQDETYYGLPGEKKTIDYTITGNWKVKDGQNLPKEYTFINGDNPDITVHVQDTTPEQKTGTLEIQYVDDDDNQKVVSSQTLTLPVDPQYSPSYQIPDGYRLSDSETPPTTYPIVEGQNTPLKIHVSEINKSVPQKISKHIYYVDDEHGWTIDSKLISGDEGSSMNLTYNIPAGYTQTPGQNLPTSYTFSQIGSDVTVKIHKNEDNSTLNIKYVDENNAVVKTTSVSGAVGEYVTLDYKAPDGYQFDQRFTADNPVQVTKTPKDVIVHVTKNPIPSTDRQIKVYYEDEHGWTLDKTQVVKGKVGQTVNISYDVPAGYQIDTNRPPVQSYTFTQDNNTNITVHVTSVKKQVPITVQYKDSETNTIVSAQQFNGTVGNTFSIPVQIPAGYEQDTSQTTDSNVFIDDDKAKTVTFYVKKIPAPSTNRTLTIHYIQSGTKWDAGTQVINGQVGQTVNINYQIPSGFHLPSNANNPKTHAFTQEGTDDSITVVVDKDINMGTVHFKFVDKATDQEVGSQDVTGPLRESTDFVYNIPSGYELDPSQTYSTSIFPDQAETTQEIKVQKIQAPSTKRTLIITYHDTTAGNDLGGQQMVDGEAGKTIDLKYNVPDGYALSNDAPKSYTFKENGDNRLTINVTPSGNQGVVNINYIDKGTNKTLHSQQIKGTIGTSWPSITTEVPDGYEIAPDQTYNLYGTFNKTPTTINITIQKKEPASTVRSLIITYHDTTTGNDLSGQQTVTGNVGQTVDLKYQVPEGYQIDPNAQKTYTFTDNTDNRLTVNVKPTTQLGEFDIRYYDSSDGHLVDTQKITGPINESYPDITLKVPTGYDVVKGQTYNLYGTFTDKPQHVDIKVEKHHDIKQQYTYRVRFIDKTTGSQIGNDQIFTGEDGSTQDLVYKLPDGYKIADGQNPAKRHTFSSKDDQADPVQIMIVPDKAQGTFTIEFIDRLTGESKGQMTFTGPVGEEPKLDFDTMALPNGYKLDPDHTPDPYNHKFSDQAQVPYKVYVVPNVTPDNQRKLTITYQAPDGSSQGTQEITGAAGQQITINYQYPSGWTAKSPDALTKTFTFDKNGDSTMTVNVVSTAKTGTIKVDYVDSDTHQVVDSQTFTGNVDDSIDLTDKFKLPAGYEADPDATTQTNFTIKSGTQTIQYLVRKPRDVNQRTVRISYINPDNYAIDHKDVVAKVGDVLNITDQLPAGYTLDTARQKGNNTYTVLDVDDRQVVDVYVLPNANKGKVVVTYINTRTQSPVGTQEIFGDVGDYLDLDDKYKLPDNYKLDPDKTPTPSVNIKDKNPINIQVFVLPSVDNARTLTINYIDPEGHTAGTQTVDGMVGNKVQLSLNAPSGFEIDPDQNIPKNYTFTVNNNQQMNIKVKAKANVNTGTAVINYINKATNESVGTQTVTGADGDYLDLNDKYQVPSGYEFSPNDTPQGSVLINKDKPANIDVYVVSKATDSTQTAQIQYVSGDKVISTQDISGKVGEKIDLSYNVPNNYKVKDPSQLQKTYTFAQTGNKNVIVEVVKDDKTPDQPTDDQKTIHINYVDDKGVTQKSTEITGKIGSNQKIVYDIPSGYHQADSSQLPSEITLQKDTQDITVHIAKDATPTNQQTIHIIYMNGNQQVGSTDVTGDVGETKNISYQAPNGYEISDTNLPQTYTFKDGNNKDIIVNVKTKSTTPDKPSQGDTQTIHINYMADGQLIKQTALSGKAGESVSVGYDIPEGYQEIAGQDLPESYTFASSGNKDITVNLQKTSTTPDVPETKRPRLTIEYVDENDHVVGNDILYGNKQGDTINVSYDKVPDGYQIVSGQNLPTTYQLTQTGQDLIVKVSKIKQGNTNPDNPSQPDNNTNNQTNPSNPSTPDNNTSGNTNTDNSNSGMDNTDNGQTDVNSPSTSDDQDNSDSTSTSGDQNNDQNDQDSQQATEEKKSDKKNTKKPGSHKTTSAPAKSGSSVATSTGSSAGQGRLPQTGNENPEALLAGALLGALGLIALGYNDKRKHDEDLKDSKNN